MKMSRKLKEEDENKILNENEEEKNFRRHFFSSGN